MSVVGGGICFVLMNTLSRAARDTKHLFDWRVDQSERACYGAYSRSTNTCSIPDLENCEGVAR